MSDLVLVPCESCDRVTRHWPSMLAMEWVCPHCKGSGWVLTEGDPISMEDLERMAPWADAPTGQPHPGEIVYVDGIPVGRL